MPCTAELRFEVSNLNTHSLEDFAFKFETYFLFSYPVS